MHVRRRGGAVRAGVRPGLRTDGGALSDPALVYAVGDPSAAGAHVLIIGVGAYDHLLDGDDEKPELADGMRQLTSPPNSARTLAEWFLSGAFDHPDRGLRSLSMVVSEQAPGPYPANANVAPHPLPNGDIASVRSAIEAWALRSAAHPGNLAFFYFSGHGVTANEPLLLCRDYGATENNRFRGAVNLGGLLAGMESRAPDEQVFVIDACRSPAALVNALMASRAQLGDGILAPDFASRRAPSLQSVHFATSGLASTFAPRGGVSFYTAALIDALNGGGAQSDLDYWVGTNGLQTALGAYTKRSASLDGVVQLPERTRSPTFMIHRPPRVQVPVYVTCAPETAWCDAMTLQAESDDHREELVHDPSSAPDRREWSTFLPVDKYRVTASFGGSRFDTAEARVLAVPPSSNCRLQIKAKP